MWAEKGSNGKLAIEVHVMDRLDLGPNANGQRGNSYNVLTEAGGFIYHGVLSGNRAMITTSQWTMYEK